jgi:hypothetical protein
MTNPNSGAADYGTSVYGSAENQHAAAGQGNLIQMNPPMRGGTYAEEPVGPKSTGGRRRGRKSRRGGTGLGEILVPAGLVLANNYTYGRYRGKNASRRRGRGRGFRPFSRYLGGEGEEMPKMTGGLDIPGMPKMGGSDMPPPKMGGNTHMSPKMGGSTFVDLAVPAGLVYANNRYYNRKRRGFTNKKRRGSRRTRGRRRR